MRDRDLYARILGIEEPWSVKDVRLEQAARRVEIVLEHAGKAACPVCEASCSRYDSRERRWRHLDTCQFQTIVVAKVPRIDCPAHGVRQVHVPWAEEGSQFTAMFECLVIDWLGESNTAAVARLMGLTWDEAQGIMNRAVQDETSFQKRHEYVTVVCNTSDGSVLHVADGRSEGALTAFYRQFSSEELAGVDTVAMDMAAPYIKATRECVPDAEEKIVFDKYHVAKHLGDTVDKVRRQEQKSLLEDGDDRLTGTKYAWLQRPANMSASTRRTLRSLKDTVLQTARAWALKEAAMKLWGYTDWSKAKAMWLRWYAWAIRSRLEPMKASARMVKNHLNGILNAVVSGITNAMSEGGVNSAIQRIKYNARGYRNRENFRNAIYFHLGNLDLHPRLHGSPWTHTIS